jgi:hypothetical protein
MGSTDKNLSTADLVGSPLYQVNLVLWMTDENNAGRVEPIFAKAGYKLLKIEQPISLPPRITRSASEAGVEMRNPVHPDLTLFSGKRRLLLECKKSMFSTKSSTARQARSLLCLVPRVLEEALAEKGGAISSTHVMYLCKADERHDQVTGLNEVADELRKAKIAATKYGVVALSASGGAVRLKAAGGTLPSEITSILQPKGVTLQKFDGDTDPRLLYIIPWVPGSEPDNDDYNRKTFAARVLLAAAEIVDRARVGSDVDLEIDDIISVMLHGYEKQWTNEALKQLRKLVKATVQPQMGLVDREVVITPLQDGRRGWVIPLSTEKAKKSVLDAFKRFSAQPVQFEFGD